MEAKIKLLIVTSLSITVLLLMLVKFSGLDQPKDITVISNSGLVLKGSEAFFTTRVIDYFRNKDSTIKFYEQSKVGFLVFKL